MNWENFQLEAYNLTRKETAVVEKQILAEYDKAISTVKEQLDKAYLNYLVGVKPENFYNEMIKRDRLNNLLAQIRSDYTNFANKAGTLQEAGLSLAFSNTFYRKMFANSWLANNARFGVLPKELVELSVLSTNEKYKAIKQSIVDKYGSKSIYMSKEGHLGFFIARNKKVELDKITSAITQAMLKGTDRNEAISIIKKIIGLTEKTDKGISLTGAKASAMKIFRTETNRIMNVASYASSKDLASTGIKIEREMLSSLDNKTRNQSARMDQQRVGIDEPFTYPNGVKAFTPGTTGVAKYDINDRETVIDIIDGESPKIRRGRNPLTGKNEVFTYKSFSSWAKENGLTKNKYGELLA